LEVKLLQAVSYNHWTHPLNTLHPAFEDGTDRGFRNVGKSQSDAGEIPKRTHTTTGLFVYILVVSDVCELRKEGERTEMATYGLNIAGKLRELTNQFY
jgi:hypothetical protein